MSRAVLLGTGAFPPILRLWLETYRKWQNEVDKLYIAVDNWNIPEARGYFLNLIKEFPNAVILENTRGWPDSYADAYKQSKEDNFLIMHDDTFVYKKGIVDNYFKIAEQGEVVTQKHEIYSPVDIVNAVLGKKYNWNSPPYSFLLYFLFISRQNLEKTSLNFNGIGWKKGDDIPLLGIENATDGIAGDTGFLLGLELFEKQVPFHWIPDRSGWVHLQNTGNTIPLWFTQDIDARAWDLKVEEARLAWLYEMMRTESFDEIPEFKKKCEDILKKVVLKCGSDIDMIEKIADNFHQLLYDKL